MNKETLAVLVGCCLSLVAILYSRCSAADADSFTTLEGCLRQALTANPALKVSKARYQAARERIPQAASLPDPMLQVTHFVESVQTRTGPQENLFMLSQRFPWFGKLDSRQQAASAEAQALLHGYQGGQLMLTRKVSLAFFEYGYLGKASELTRKNRDWLAGLEPIIEERIKGGGELNPLLRLKVEIGRINDKLDSLLRQRDVKSARLRELLALSDASLLPWPQWVKPSQVKVDEQTVLAAVEYNNPELLMLKQKIISAKAKQETARLESYPDVTLGINYIQIDNPEVNPMPPDAGDDPWGGTAAINIPLWFDKNKAVCAEALAGRHAAEHEHQDRLNSLKAELRAAMALLDDANRRLNLYGKELVGLAEQALENSQIGYVSGRVSILEVIDSERSLLDLQLLSWRAAADAWQQRVILQTLVNQPVSGIAITESTHD